MLTPTEDIHTVYADAQVLVVNKPSGLLSVPGRGADKWDCVVHRVQKDYPTARIVHRLDCATSGLMVLALDADSHRELSRQFHDREVDKAYEALVVGHLAPSEGSIEQPLITDWPNRPRQKICYETGKQAKTNFLVKEHTRVQSGNRPDKLLAATRVALTPITGRSHQLRVHMLSTGHPILGDCLYAPPEATEGFERLCLHASFLAVTHPINKERMEFHLNVPF